MKDYCIIYISDSVELLEEVDFSTLLLQSRRDNIKENITGVLLCLNGRIIQVLEGRQVSLDLLYTRIERDRRHTNVTTVFQNAIDQRHFTSWSMGYETLTVRQLEEITVIADLNNKEKFISKDGARLLKLLKEFYDSNRLP